MGVRQGRGGTIYKLDMPPESETILDEKAKHKLSELLHDQMAAYVRSKGRDHKMRYRLDLGNLGKIGDGDAQRFLRSLELGLVRPRDDGDFEVVGGRRKLRVFSYGRQRAGAQRISASVVPIVTIGALSWLHVEMGGPEELMVPVPRRGAFDLSCRKPGSATWFLHCEVGATAGEVNRMVDFLVNHAAGPTSRPKTPWMKKAEAMWREPSALFCTLVPNAHCRVFRLGEGAESLVLSEGQVEDLRYPFIRTGSRWTLS